MPDGLFIFFAALTLGAASLLVLSRNAVTSAMGMILALVGVAADFFLLDAYFLGVLQVLVYAGAIMVVFSCAQRHSYATHTEPLLLPAV